jgi:SAM-dependent methyltransferase
MISHPQLIELKYKVIEALKPGAKSKVFLCPLMHGLEKKWLKTLAFLKLRGNILRDVYLMESIMHDEYSGPVDWTSTFFSSVYLDLYRNRLMDEDLTAVEADFVWRTIAIKQDDFFLDLACGFGRHLLCWKQMGLKNVYGLDVNFDFLNHVMCELHNDAICIQGLMEVLPFKCNSFQAIACLFNSLGYRDVDGAASNTGEGDVERERKVFQECARILKPGGKLIFDIPAFRGMKSTIKEHPVTCIVASDGYEMIENWTIDESNRLLFDNGVIKRRGREHAFRYCVRLYDFAEVESLLNEAEFEVLDCWEDFNGEPYDDEDSERLICLARLNS